MCDGCCRMADLIAVEDLADVPRDVTRGNEKRRKMVTRKEVAKEAGVSPATVSHVINNTKYVSPELRKRVEEAIRRLDYRPNMVARSLATKTTKHVGILVNDITNPYYGEIAQGMEEVARHYGYMVSLCVASGDSEKYFANILQRQMDGLFIATVEHGFSSSQLEKLKKSGIAIVNGMDKEKASIIDFDYAETIDETVKYLKDMGHIRIGFLSGLSINHPGHMRYQAYVSAVKKYGTCLDPNLIIDGEFPFHTTSQSGYIAMKKLLARTHATAVIASNDLMAFGAMRAIREAGFRIPEDISVVGCDDIFWAECMEPPLTTIRAPKKQMGREAMHMILKQLKDGETEEIFLKTELIIRGSTGMAPSAR